MKIVEYGARYVDDLERRLHQAESEGKEPSRIDQLTGQLLVFALLVLASILVGNILLSTVFNP